MDSSGNSVMELEGFGGGQIEEINNYNALQDAIIRESHEDRSEFSTIECTWVCIMFSWTKMKLWYYWN